MFKEKETLLQNLAFMGIMAAINVLFSLLATYVPLATIFVMIFLPFFSAMVTILCKRKYYLIYAIATISVSLAITPFNIDFTLFSLIPSVITGFLFGLCVIHKINGVEAILFTSLIQLGLIYLSFPIINAIYGVDMIYDFLTLFKLNNDVTYIMIIVPSFIYLISLIEMSFSYIVLNNEIRKIMKHEDKNITLPTKILGISCAILLIPFLFVALNICYLLMFISLFIGVAVGVEDMMDSSKSKLFVYPICLLVGFVLIFALYSIIKKPYTLLLINVSNILIYGVHLLYNLKRVN